MKPPAPIVMTKAKLAQSNRAWKLRIEGWSIPEIANEMDLPVHIVRDNISKARRASVPETTESMAKLMGEIELARLDHLQKLLMEDLTTTIDTMWKFKKAKNKGDFPDHEFVAESIKRVDLKVVDRILAIMDKRAKYMGLYQAQEVNHNHKTLEEIVLLSFKSPEELEEGKVIDVEAGSE